MGHRVVHVLIWSRTPLRVLLLRRPERRVAGWQGVTGRVEPHDADLVAACVREIHEETGLPPPVELADLGFERSFDGYDDVTYDQRSFAARYPAPLEPRLSEEHEEGRWVEPEEALRLVRWESDRDALRWLVRHVAALK